jgi:hypothetical protein
VTEFLPAYATEAARAAAVPRAEPAGQDGTRVLWTALAAAIVAALLVPIVAGIRNRR